jgi:hypothetical protein
MCKSFAIAGSVTVTKPAKRLEIPVTHVTEVITRNVVPLPISLWVTVLSILDLADSNGFDGTFETLFVLVNVIVESNAVVCADSGTDN